MNKRKYILLGSAFFLIAVICYGYIMSVSVQGTGAHPYLNDENIAIHMLPVLCIFAASFGLGGAMFIKAQIIPNWLRWFFKFFGIVSGVAFAATALYLLSGGAIG